MYKQPAKGSGFDSDHHMFVQGADRDLRLRRYAILTQDSFHHLQYELRRYSLACRTRFNDPSVDMLARNLADREVEDALLQFKNLVVDRAGIQPALPRERPHYDRSPHHNSEHYPDFIDGHDLQIVRNNPYSRRREALVVPGDGDLLLRHAIVVDYCFERVDDGICNYATILHDGSRVFYDFLDDVVRKLHERFHGIAQDDRSRLAEENTPLQPAQPVVRRLLRSITGRASRDLQRTH